MTDKELEKLGVIAVNSKLRPLKYWCNATQSEIRVLRECTPEILMGIIFDEGVRQGVRDGQELRSKQIRGLLNNEDLI